MSSEQASKRIVTPMPYRAVAALLVLAGITLAAVGVVLALGISGNAKASAVEGVVHQVEALVATNDCVRQVSSDYDQARDDVLLALGKGQAAFDRAQGELERLYYPHGRTGPQVTRADAFRQRCPGTR